MGSKAQSAALDEALGFQVTLSGEMHGIATEEALNKAIRSGLPIHMAGLLEEPAWRWALFEGESWKEAAMKLERRFNLQAFKFAARMVAAETAALVAAHDAYFAALANVGRVFGAEGVDGLRKAAASCPQVADKPGQFPIE